MGGDFNNPNVPFDPSGPIYLPPGSAIGPNGLPYFPNQGSSNQGGWQPPNTTFQPSGGGVVNNLANFISGGQNQNAQKLYTEAGNAFAGILTPSIAQMKIKLQQLVQQGVLTPEQAQTFQQDPSVLNQYTEDPRLREAQLKSLGQLGGIVDANGLDPQARAALYQLQGQTNANERGQREAILQNAAARGISGSGLELASNLANEQGNATGLAAQGFNAASDANQRKLEAINNLAAQGGAMRSQDYGQAANTAAAQNAINQFNTANQQNVENQNLAYRNAAQAQNLAEKQRISDTNTGLTNQQNVFNKGLNQQNFQNQLGLATGFANAGLGAANVAQNQANANSGLVQNLIGGVLNAVSDENLKENVKPFDAGAFLDKITGHRYNYKKGTGLSTKPRVGAMAQDILKVAPEAVNESPIGKTVDYGKLGPPMLASLSSLHQRIKKLEGKK